MTAPGLDVGVALLILPAFAPAGIRRLRRAALWCTVMAYAVGVASLFGRRP